MKIKLIIIIIVTLTIVACSNNPPKNENLPEGMVGGFWVSPPGSESNGFFFLNNGFFSAGGSNEGTYQLMSDGTLLLQIEDYYLESFEVSVSESGKRIIMSNSNLEDIILDLAWEDKSSGNLEREIVGKWGYADLELDEENLYTIMVSDDMWEFTQDGEVIWGDYIDNENEEVYGTGTYEWLNGKLIVEGKFTDRAIAYEINETYTILSLGDLLYLFSDNNGALFLVRRE